MWVERTVTCSTGRPAIDPLKRSYPIALRNVADDVGDQHLEAVVGHVGEAGGDPGEDPAQVLSRGPGAAWALPGRIRMDEEEERDAVRSRSSRSRSSLARGRAVSRCPLRASVSAGDTREEASAAGCPTLLLRMECASLRFPKREASCGQPRPRRVEGSRARRRGSPPARCRRCRRWRSTHAPRRSRHRA